MRIKINAMVAKARDTPGAYYKGIKLFVWLYCPCTRHLQHYCKVSRDTGFNVKRSIRTLLYSQRYNEMLKRKLNLNFGCFQ